MFSVNDKNVKWYNGRSGHLDDFSPIFLSFAGWILVIYMLVAYLTK